VKDDVFIFQNKMMKDFAKDAKNLFWNEEAD